MVIRRKGNLRAIWFIRVCTRNLFISSGAGIRGSSTLRILAVHRVTMATAPSLLSESLSFIAKLEDRVKVTGAALCVGLDPHTSDLNSNDGAGLVAFCKSIIDAT